MGKEHLLRHQDANRTKTQAAILQTMQLIDEEHAAGQVTSGEITKRYLVRRAGVGESTLKNPSHKDTLATVDAWLRSFKLPKREGNRANPDSRAAFAALARELDRAKLEVERAHNELAALKSENTRLRGQLTRVQTDLDKVSRKPRLRPV